MLAPMLGPAVAVLTLVVLLGLTLALLHMRPGRGAPALLGAAHGVLGATGIVLLLLAAQRSAKAAAQGAGTFGFDATWLLVFALLLGLTVLYFVRRGRAGQAALMIVLHGTIAVMGYVILVAYWSLA
jgi:hypothetical protein